MGVGPSDDESPPRFETNTPTKIPCVGAVAHQLTGTSQIHLATNAFSYSPSLPPPPVDAVLSSSTKAKKASCPGPGSQLHSEGRDKGEAKEESIKNK